MITTADEAVIKKGVITFKALQYPLPKHLQERLKYAAINVGKNEMNVDLEALERQIRASHGQLYSRPFIPSRKKELEQALNQTLECA